MKKLTDRYESLNQRFLFYFGLFVVCIIAHKYLHHLIPSVVPACLCTQLLDLKLTVDGLEKERDFYFGKLRDIELICQENESPVLSKIIDILYATEVNTVRLHTYQMCV